jgi:glycosyltransferase involved in cell wall biosynthesis
MESEVQGISELLGKHVTFTGHVGIDQLALEYSLSDVVCLASYYEGFGLPLLEAMAFGRPIVCSNATCLPEIGGSAAIYADPGDVDAWSSAVLGLLSDAALRRRFVEAGRERVQSFSWSSTVATLRQAMQAAAS